MGAKASTHEWGPDIKAICAEGEDPDDKQFPREVGRELHCSKQSNMCFLL